MSINIIAHAVGTTPKSVFAVEFVNGDESTIYRYNPTSYTKYNPLFDPFILGGSRVNIAPIMELYPEGTKFFATSASKKLLGTQGDCLRLVKKTESFLETHVETHVEPHVEPRVEPLFEVNEPPVGAVPGDCSTSCPWAQSIVTTNSVYIYEKPFSNFTRFGFTILGYYFPTLEHFIMFLRVLVLSPMESVEATYAFLEKTFRWSTGMMKRYVKAHIARAGTKRGAELEEELIAKNNKYFLYALYRKVLSHPGMLSFFLRNSKKTFYEVAQINSVWVINAPFDLKRKDDSDYLDELDDAAELYGETRNVFGKYLTSVARMVDEDQDRVLEGVELATIFAEREANFLEGFE